MPVYEYHCDVCDCPFDVVKSIADYSRPEVCPVCQAQGKRVVSEMSFCLKGDGWPGKDMRVCQQMSSRRTKIAQKERDHVVPPMSIVPNVGGEETKTWAEAQKLAADKGKDVSSYTPFVQKEKEVKT